MATIQSNTRRQLSRLDHLALVGWALLAASHHRHQDELQDIASSTLQCTVSRSHPISPCLGSTSELMSRGTCLSHPLDVDPTDSIIMTNQTNRLRPGFDRTICTSRRARRFFFFLDLVHRPFKHMGEQATLTRVTDGTAQAMPAPLPGMLLPEGVCPGAHFITKAPIFAPFPLPAHQS